MVRIAIDAMGGDNAPKEIVQGVVLAAKEMPTVEFQLYGDEAKVNECLEESLPNIRVIHCSEKINSDDEPVKAIRSKKDASMVVAAKAVKEGEADALFSCGNTGALLTAGLLVVGRIKGIDRPGLMPVLPVLGKENRQFIMMDVGANAECKPKNVHQFGILGSYYAKYVLGYENPTVGLLNNGAEEGKGNELAKEVYGLLKEDESLNFVGNVEARNRCCGCRCDRRIHRKRRIENNRRNSACDDGTSKRRHQRTRHPRKTWSALTQEYILRIKEHIGLLTIRGCGALWS